MGKVVLILALVQIALSSEGKVLFETHCMKCHAQNSPKPLTYLKEKYRNNPQAVINLAKRCPWGRDLSEMEIKIIAEWLSGKK